MQFSILLGSTLAKVTQNGHNSSPVFGLMKKKKFQRGDCERLLRKMVIDGILQENLHIGVHDQAISYATTGPKAPDVLSGRKQVGLGNMRKIVSFVPAVCQPMPSPPPLPPFSFIAFSFQKSMLKPLSFLFPRNISMWLY